jgi:hypothetical protein
VSRDLLTLCWDVEHTDGVEVLIDGGPHDDNAQDGPTEVVGYIVLH